MARPALTIALLLRTPALVKACRQWLPGNRYEPVVVDVAEQDNLAELLQRRQDEIDAVVVEQPLLDAATREQLVSSGLLFPAVVVGEVKGHVDYHSCLLYTSDAADE